MPPDDGVPRTADTADAAAGADGAAAADDAGAGDADGGGSGAFGSLSPPRPLAVVLTTPAEAVRCRGGRATGLTRDGALPRPIECDCAQSAALSALGDRGSIALDVGADGGDHVRQVREENPMPQRRARQPSQRAGPAAELEDRQGLLLLLLLHGARRVRRRGGRQQRRERPSGTLKTAAVTGTRHHDREPRVVCMARSAEKNRANLPLGSRQAATREAARQSEDGQTIPPMLRCWLCTTTSRRPGGRSPGTSISRALCCAPPLWNWRKNPSSSPVCFKRPASSARSARFCRRIDSARVRSSSLPAARSSSLPAALSSSGAEGGAASIQKKTARRDAATP